MSAASPTNLAILTIAGSDSSGGAGIQADLKSFAAMGCYGASVITALTAQNTLGVQAIHAPPPDFVEQQIRAVLEDVHIDAIKTGMLFDENITRIVATTLKKHYAGNATRPPLVCDPVCVSTSGHTLLHSNAVEVMIKELFPLADLITPNKSEAELLLSFRTPSTKIETLEDMIAAASNLLQLGPKAVLVKGGHIIATAGDIERIARRHPDIHISRDGTLGDNMEILQLAEKDTDAQLVVDVLDQGNGNVTLFVGRRIESTSTHGTGCTLSAALACELGRGSDLVTATSVATAYTQHGIETAHAIGSGHGPLNHLHSITQRQIPQPTPSNPHPFTRLLIQGTAKTWKQYVEHDFVKLLGKGTLQRESFIHFLKQDYQYLKYYARAYGLLAAKSNSFASIKSAADTILYVVREIGTHKFFCAQFGITEEELENTPESTATTAYGCYLIDVGLQGDATSLIMALLACLLGYGEVGLWLKKQASIPDAWVKLEGNPYLKWIEDYAGPDYQAAVKLGLETIEGRALADPPSPARFEEWRKVWEKCTLLEKGFWDMAMNPNA